MKQALLILVLSLSSLSCDREESSIRYNEEDNITTDESLKSSLLHITQNATAKDNIIDNSSCFSIQFPYTVQANGTVVTINSEADYQTVIDLLDASVTDYDVVTLQYPVTAVYADYTEEVFSTETNYTTALSNCSESVELSCLGPNYPIGVETYISYEQTAESFTLGSKNALYEFIKGINVYDAVTFNYPFTFNTPNGEVTINNKTTLKGEIAAYTDSCIQSLNLPPAFDDVIIQDTWYVSYYYADTELTANFTNYNFTFNTNGTIVVTESSTTTTEGMWDKSPDDIDPMVALAFQDATLGMYLSGVWSINRVNNNLIQLRIPGSGTIDPIYFNLSRN